MHTPSMHQALLEGDYILVNKLTYGPRLPITILNWPFELKLPYIRIPGYSLVERNDVVVFNFPADTSRNIDERQQYVKRCIAIAGDTLLIKEGSIYINGHELAESADVLYQYDVSTNGTEVDSSVLSELDGYTPLHKYGSVKQSFFLSLASADSVKRLKSISKVERIVVNEEFYSPNLYPHSSFFKWNQDNFGPFFIPKAGTTILLSPKTIILYGKIIQDETASTLSSRNDSVFINGIYSPVYTFKMNYFFMMGDNRYHSIDSRAWGVVPENHIIGKASFVLFASRKKPLQKGRSFSSINN